MQRKLVVEVVEARDLLPKDGHGTSSPYAVVDFDGQRRRTRTAPRELNPTWNEALVFDVSSSNASVPNDSASSGGGGGGGGEPLEVDVFHDKRTGPPSRRSNFLGRVRLDSAGFVRKGEEALIYFPLEKKNWFSWVRGEIGLKVYYVDEPVKPVEDAPPPPPPDAGQPAKPVEDTPAPPGKPVEDTPPPPPPDAAVDPAPPTPEPPASTEAPPPQAEEPPPPPERTTFDLVEKMHYLFVRVVRARSLAPKAARAYVRLSIPGVQVRTSATGSRNGGVSFEWDQTFAFARGGVGGGGAGDGSDYASTLEVSVWDEQGRTGPGPVFLGGVCFDASDVPLRDPPDSPLAPQWYRLEGRGRKGGGGGGGGGDLMLATWIGTQADESFADAWKSETAASAAAHAKSKVYLSPKMCLLAMIKHLCSLETRPGKDAPLVLGTAHVPLALIERRVDDRKIAPRWVDLDSGGGAGGRLQVRVCFDGGYHVADEPAHAASDYRPSARQLWGPSVGTVELGLVGCRGLVPHKPGACYYAVAKYGPKWARTRGVPGGDGGMADAMWNEQYTWQVFDPCTVLTVAVFASDEYLGRVRIRVSSLESGVAYRNTYALMTLSPAGVRKSGDVDIAVRFSRAVHAVDLMHAYTRPMLPMMHHVRPIGAARTDALRITAARIVAEHLARSEPSLLTEVVLRVLDATPKSGFSMRGLKANWARVGRALSWAGDVVAWVDEARKWRRPTTTALAHALLMLTVCYPSLIGPALTLHMCVVGAWKYRGRARGPAQACARLSAVEVVGPDELDEEFDGVPSGRDAEVVRARYDRLRTLGGWAQVVLGELAGHGERVRAVVEWRDPRATLMFMGACMVASVVLFAVPIKAIAVAAGFYHLRHPMFRDRAPPVAVNFFWRLPSLEDRMM
ncbi:hypothetical protein QJS10_CPB15g02148 [Acorus calamus]|uniref:C2 domain-containing protein n=1 Tax=Acorus calamus TaxID=4465 RepID=A0AAV9DAC6_ACOCL|nr:hypothetical protein QJS10_CPB15g02148 [Acorus calamus]